MKLPRGPAVALDLCPAMLEASGSADIEAWTKEEPAAIEPLETYLGTPCLRGHPERVPAAGRRAAVGGSPASCRARRSTPCG